MDMLIVSSNMIAIVTLTFDNCSYISSFLYVYSYIIVLCFNCLSLYSCEIVFQLF